MAPPLDSDASKDSYSYKGTWSSRNDTSTAPEKLQSLGLISVTWFGKCEADKVSKGTLPIAAGNGGMYAMIFDNTFSKQMSKTATFVLLTYPSNAPPQSIHQPHHTQFSSTISSSSSTSAKSPTHLPTALPLTQGDFVPLQRDGGSNEVERPPSKEGSVTHTGSSPGYYTGTLQKRRRKRHQGFARRFFSLDFDSAILSYYHDRNSSMLRGAIPLSLAVIGANETRREISVDSGAEVWHLRASNWKEFFAWKDALERVSTQAASLSTPGPGTAPTVPSSNPVSDAIAAEDREWLSVEALVGRMVGTRDAVRRIITGPNSPPFHSPRTGLGIQSSAAEPSPVEAVEGDYFVERQKRSFWKRKPSSGTSSPDLYHRASSGQLAVPLTTVPNGVAIHGRSLSPSPTRKPEQPDDQLRGIAKDLDCIIADFSTLLNESKSRRQAAPASTGRRLSLDSTASEEFFDADAGELRKSQVLLIPDSDEEDSEEGLVTDDDSASSDGEDHHGQAGRQEGSRELELGLFPRSPKSLTPLPLDRVSRRSTVPKPKMLPPSLIGFLRKNVGKDLSTVSMPVSANEPISLLQRSSEQLEYSSLLVAAANAGKSSPEGLLHVTAFAVSAFSNTRVKERSIRKPFNPMLGETFELVREDLGFRFLAEKVSHRPVTMACQAEASQWTFTQAPAPIQKFWGKSVELIQEGAVRVFLHDTAECFTWSSATCFLRNIIAGEKYVEPVGTMTILNESTGQKAVVTFKAKGMWSGRNEDVTVEAFDPEGSPLPQGLAGKWTSSLSLTENGKEVKQIWCIGALVADAPSRYGFTDLAATLNEVTSIEADRLPPTDSRLRADQRAAEEGDLDSAEALKARLEEGQRQRRKEMEDSGSAWQPTWFTKVDGAKDAWIMKSGPDNYWERREKRDWQGVVNVLDF